MPCPLQSSWTRTWYKFKASPFPSSKLALVSHPGGKDVHGQASAPLPLFWLLNTLNQSGGEGQGRRKEEHSSMTGIGWRPSISVVFTWRMVNAICVHPEFLLHYFPCFRVSITSIFMTHLCQLTFCCSAHSLQVCSGPHAPPSRQTSWTILDNSKPVLFTAWPRSDLG